MMMIDYFQHLVVRPSVCL